MTKVRTTKRTTAQTATRTKVLGALSIAVAAAFSVTVVPAAVAAEDDQHVDLSVVVPSGDTGEFIWSAPVSVDLGTASTVSDRLRATSSGLEVNVTDTRLGQPSWLISGAATQFTDLDSQPAFSAAYLGWRPEVVVAGAGATAGAEAASGFDPSNPTVPVDSASRGLASDKVLASAPLNHAASPASATIVAHLTLDLPIGTTPGAYESVLSLTAELG